MGCYFHKARFDSRKADNSEKKEYSWDKRCKVNSSDYLVQDIIDSEVVRLPGSVNGQQFIIQNCKNSTFYILDHMNAVVIDDCLDCKIVLGAVKGSVFLRDCKECVCIVACGQFRARDCRKLDIFLCCPTRPVLESSGSIHFGCYQLFYSGLEDHFSKTNLSAFNNEWSNIHDFTPIDGEDNWCLLPDTLSINDYISTPESEKTAQLGLTFSAEKSVVPHTWGPHKIISGQVCLVIFFYDGHQSLRVNKFINKMKMDNPECLLLLSKEKQMSSRDAELVFKSSAYNNVVTDGHVVGLQFCGPNCIQVCEKIISRLNKGESDLIHITTNVTTSHQQADLFFNASMNAICS
ncbi:Protein XRP2 [Gryllus bimaculatus]|nr:Protein XRP2 [Gryllus bimaculatus]